MTWFHVESINYPSTEGTPLHAIKEHCTVRSSAVRGPDTPIKKGECDNKIQQTVDGGGVSTPCGMVSTQGITFFVRGLLKL